MLFLKAKVAGEEVCFFYELEEHETADRAFISICQLLNQLLQCHWHITITPRYKKFDSEFHDLQTWVDNFNFKKLMSKKPKVVVSRGERYGLPCIDYMNWESQIRRNGLTGTVMWSGAN